MSRRYKSARGMSGFLLVVVVFVIASCGEKPRSGLLPNDELARIYADMAFIKELYIGNTAKYELAMDSLLRAHNTDTLAISQSFAELSKNPEELDKVYTEALNILDELTKADSASTPPNTVSQ